MLTKHQQRMGFYENRSGLLLLNSVQFANYLILIYGFILTPDDTWYIYSSGVFHQIVEREVLSIAMKELIHEFSDFYSKKLEAVYLEALKNLCFCKKELNSYKNLINLKNGMFDIETKKLLPHDRKYLSTIQLDIEYDKNAKCPLFKEFLIDIFNKDKSLCRVVQEIMGYTLYPDTPTHKFFLFYGSGANGKSVLLNIMLALVGKGNYTTLSIRDLSRTFARIEIKDKSLLCSSENESLSGKGFDSQYLKAISGGDEINAEHKGKPMITFKPFCKMIFSLNTLPNISDRTEGFMRRLVIIPFENSYSIDDGTADIHLEEKLKEELSGIFNLAVKGLNRLKKNDFRFTKCEKIDVYLKEYELSINPYMEFWNERIEFISDSSEQRTRKSDVYNEYIKWAEDNHHFFSSRVTETKFWLELKKVAKRISGQPLKEKKSNDKRFITNIILRDEWGNQLCEVNYRKLIKRLNDKTPRISTELNLSDYDYVDEDDDEDDEQ